ncbi:MAG: carboxysome shell carbonic anhydrase [Patescibacteria group bacterium]|nr:carboxysome shell carbonic anhydrase [Patescibacteria group bacterium]
MLKKLAVAPVEERYQWLRERNEEFAAKFSADWSARHLYRRRHPTEIMAFKCMDGRIHLPHMTGLPAGIIQPMRNLGGIFDLGWPLLNELVWEWYKYSLSHKSKCLVVITYHYSAGDHHRGCAGFNHDTEAAFAFTKRFKEQFERVFGKEHATLYPIIIGIETDEESFVLHGENDDKLALVDSLELPGEELEHKLTNLFPDMDREIVRDLLPLVYGNINHIKQIRLSGRSIVETEHNEWMIGIGRGFDWLHEPNVALIIGPFDIDLYVAIKKALSIIQHNLEEDKIGKDGFVLMSSAFHRQNIGPDVNRIVEKAVFLNKFAQSIAREEFPDLAKIMKPMTVTIDANTRKFSHII